MQLNEISIKEVKHLEPDELVDLLDVLLAGEIAIHYLPYEIDKFSVPKPITIKDGGEDANVWLDLEPSKTITSQWLKNSYTSFQCKAQKMTITSCYKEVQIDSKQGKDLKPRIKECISNNGEYVLFTTDTLTDKAIVDRVSKIRQAFTECGVSNVANTAIRIIDANQIVKWANTVLKAIVFIQKCRGVTRPRAFVTWQDWQRQVLAVKKYSYQESDYLATHSQTLYDILEKDKIVRVTGHKGIGKTRFVLESFNPVKNNYIKNLSDRLVYIDLAIADEKELGAFIYSHSNLDGIIVVDNCPDSWHDSFATPIRSGGNLKLVTIFDSQTISSKSIWLDRKSQKAAVRLILENCFPGFNSSNIDHLLNISEGFPEMIPFIENAITQDNPEIVFNTIPDKFIEKFLFPEESDKEEYDLFKACSLFTEFSFFDDKIEDILGDQEKQTILLQNELIHTKIVQTPTTFNKFYAFCVKYRDKRSLLEKRGYQYSVIPEPIAVSLAAVWWDEHDFSYVENILSELQQQNLLIPMMDRLRSLDQSERARGIASKAWGPNGPFVTAEVLNTELGSRLFRSVVEVNPQSTLNGLEEAFDEFSIDEYRNKVTTGRRNLVWALEKLAFRKETFLGACKQLSKFAAGENENFGNNATAQFFQLFHIHLPGTEANLLERLAIIDWALLHPEKEIQKLAIHAMGHGLKSHGFTRMGGAEQQGFGTFLKEYSPITWQEVVDYWIAIIRRLTRIAISNDEFKIIAKDTIADHIRSLFSNNLSWLAEEAITEIISSENVVWESAIKNLTVTRGYDTKTSEELALIDNLLSLLKPASVSDRLHLLVVLPIWNYSPANIRGEETKKAAEDFADEFWSSKLDLKQHLPMLLSGEQRQTFNFAARYASYFENLTDIVDAALFELQKIPQEKQNAAFLAGIISVLNQGQQRLLIEKISSSPKISFHIFYLIKLTKPSLEDLNILFDLVNRGDVSIAKFSSLQYGHALDHIGSNRIIQLCEKIATYGFEGRWTSFLLIATYYFQDDQKWADCKDFVRNLIIENNFIAGFANTNHNDEYHWSQTVLRLLSEYDDEELAKEISNQYNEVIQKDELSYFDHELKEIMGILFKKYFFIVWPIISPLILTTGISYLAIREMIGSHNGANGNKGLLQYADNETIITWCKTHGELALRRITYMMPLFGEAGWHPFALKMINTFSDKEGFLNEIAANLGSFSMVGSSKNYYETIIGMAKDLLSHESLKLKKWAKNCIRHYEKQIRREQLDDELRK